MSTGSLSDVDDELLLDGILKFGGGGSSSTGTGSNTESTEESGSNCEDHHRGSGGGSGGGGGGGSAHRHAPGRKKRSSAASRKASSASAAAAAAAAQQAAALQGTHDGAGGKQVQRNAANARERARMRVLSKAFSRLKTTLPWVPADTKLSKLDTLRLASSYIAHLRQILANDKYENGFIHPVNLTWPFMVAGKPETDLKEMLNSTRLCGTSAS